LKVHAATRTLTIFLGCIGVAWGLTTFPIFKRNADIDDVASRIIRRFVFRPQSLVDQVPTLEAIENEPYCEPRALRSDAVIRLRIAENALTNADVDRLDANMTAARAAIRKSLSCSPTDSYLWLSLFWVNAISEGFRPSDFALLRKSYEEGPNEGWIMVTRNHLALADFPSLPPDLADRALTEFSELLQPEFVDAAADNFVGPGWPIHALLLDRIKNAPESERSTFARMLEAKGYDVEVPGIARKGRLDH
jgi:hypothetical protein